MNRWESGTEADRLWILDHFSKEENLDHFSLIFSDYITKNIPDFHKEIYREYTEHQGFIGVAAPRGFAKSTITDLFFLAWCALNGKKHFIVLISDTYTQAVSFLDGFKNEIESNQIVKWLYPGALGEIWSNDKLVINSWDNKTGKMSVCCLQAKGAGMKIRGLRFRNWRPDLILIDDLENDEMVENADRRLKTKRWLLRAVIPALAKDGDIVMIGTILHFDSVLKNIIDKKEEFAGWRTKLFRAITDDNQSIWPEHYTVEELLRMRSDPTHPKYVGPLTFSQEYQNNPIDETERIFQEDWTKIRFKLAEEETSYIQNNPESTTTWIKDKFKRVITAVDPAISEKTSADYFAMSTIGIAKTDGHIWILDYFQKRIGDPLEQAKVILDNYIRWKSDVVKIEAVAYQMGLYQLVKRIGAEENIYPTLSPYVPDKDKRRRAIIHSANFAGSLVHLREDHPLFLSFLAEILEFPLGAHDDMLDAYMGAADELVLNTKARTFSAKPMGL
jgi:predicted phage terminase large subunit-like protein